MLTIVMPLHREEETAKISLLLLKEKTSRPYPLIVMDSAPGTTNLRQFMECWLGWKGAASYMPEAGIAPSEALAKGLEIAETAIVVYLHQDTMLLEQDWDLRLLGRMQPDKELVLCGLFGFQLYRRGFTDRAGWRMSNMAEAGHHGARLTGFREAGGVDGFFMAMRRDFYRGRVDPALRFHLYDYDLCLQAHAEGKRVGVLGVYCHHGRAASQLPGSQEREHLSQKWVGDARVTGLLS